MCNVLQICICRAAVIKWDTLDIISYPLFADADTAIYPHAASQYHARPKAKRGIVMLSVDKLSYKYIRLYAWILMVSILQDKSQTTQNYSSKCNQKYLV